MLKILFATAVMFGYMTPVSWFSPSPDELRANTFELMIDGGHCSATAVGPSTILTATHCLIGQHHIWLDGKAEKVIAIVNDGHDHSLVTVKDTFTHVAKLAHKMPNVGSEIQYIGNPDVLVQLYRKGTYLGEQYQDGIHWQVLDISGYMGDSGSGVFDEDGRLIGVVSVRMRLSNPDEDGGAPACFMGMFPLAFTPQQLLTATHG